MKNPSIKLAPLSLRFRQARFKAVKQNIDMLSPHFSWCPTHFNQQHNREHVQTCLEQQGLEMGHYFVILNATGHFVGEVGLDTIYFTEQYANVFYWIDKNQQGKGFATGAVQLLCQWVNQHLELKMLEIKAELKNLGSQRVAMKCNGTFSHVVPAIAKTSGVSTDVCVYRIALA